MLPSILFIWDTWILIGVGLYFKDLEIVNKISNEMSIPKQEAQPNENLQQPLSA